MLVQLCLLLLVFCTQKTAATTVVTSGAELQVCIKITILQLEENSYIFGVRFTFYIYFKGKDLKTCLYFVC